MIVYVLTSDYYGVFDEVFESRLEAFEAADGLNKGTEYSRHYWVVEKQLKRQ